MIHKTNIMETSFKHWKLTSLISSITLDLIIKFLLACDYIWKHESRIDMLNETLKSEDKH